MVMGGSYLVFLLLRCEMEPIQFFSARIVPVLDMKVVIDSDKPVAVISAVSAKVS